MSQARWAEGVEVADPGRVSPPFAAAIRRFVLPLVRVLWRPTLTGTENLPNGPFVLVANHSAGMGVAEIHSFLALYLERFGATRPLAGVALPLGFRAWPLSLAHRHLGTIPSSYAAAANALARGVPILIFPGGDHESLRPIWDLHRVDFAGRVGFLRIAHRAGVPVVPLGIRGGHWTAPILVRSQWLATALVFPRFLGIKRWGVSLLGLLVALAIACFVPFAWPLRVLLVWLWLGSPLVFLPWLPWTVRMRVGPALPLSLLGDGSDAALRAALPQVEAAIHAQTLLPSAQNGL